MKFESCGQTLALDVSNIYSTVRFVHRLVLSTSLVTVCRGIMATFGAPFGQFLWPCEDESLPKVVNKPKQWQRASLRWQTALNVSQ